MSFFIRKFRYKGDIKITTIIYYKINQRNISSNANKVHP